MAGSYQRPKSLVIIGSTLPNDREGHPRTFQATKAASLSSRSLGEPSAVCGDESLFVLDERGVWPAALVVGLSAGPRIAIGI